jgi:hypothetical protein
MISTNLQAKHARESAKPSKLANVMSFFLLAGLAVLYGFSTAFYLIHKGVLS